MFNRLIQMAQFLDSLNERIEFCYKQNSISLSSYNCKRISPKCRLRINLASTLYVITHTIINPVSQEKPGIND